MSMIRPSDPDFRICLVDFNTLLEIQSDAERLGFATRWTSVDALSGQAKEQDAVLQTLMREKRAGAIRSYRCLLLFFGRGWCSFWRAGDNRPRFCATRIAGSARQGPGCQEGARPNLLDGARRNLGS
jgi:hypothetical protein